MWSPGTYWWIHGVRSSSVTLVWVGSSQTLWPLLLLGVDLSCWYVDILWFISQMYKFWSSTLPWWLNWLTVYVVLYMCSVFICLNFRYDLIHLHKFDWSPVLEPVTSNCLMFLCIYLIVFPCCLRVSLRDCRKPTIMCNQWSMCLSLEELSVRRYSIPPPDAKILGAMDDQTQTTG